MSEDFDFDPPTGRIKVGPVASPWRDISEAPKYDRTNRGRVVYIDILAKIWLKDKDTFEFKRFPNCYWRDKFDNTSAHWLGVPEDWRAVAWMPIPEIPKQWP